MQFHCVEPKKKFLSPVGPLLCSLPLRLESQPNVLYARSSSIGEREATDLGSMSTGDWLLPQHAGNSSEHHALVSDNIGFSVSKPKH